MRTLILRGIESNRWLKPSSDIVIHDDIMHSHDIHKSSSHSTKNPKNKRDLLNWNTGGVSVA